MTSLPRQLPDAPAHWLNIAAMLADLVFETDIAGRFTAFGRTDVLGFAAQELLGQHLSDLFVLRGGEGRADFREIFATIYSRHAEWRGVVTLCYADGAQGRYQLFLAPKLAAFGAADRGDGAYGLLIDLEAPELRALSPDAQTGQSALDPQTGLWSAASFTEETSRRFDRLDVEGLPGTLLLLGFGRTKPVGRSAVAKRLAEELRDIIRPTDLLGRLNATTFALWCDGMDDLTGAERAARFCQRLPHAIPGQPCISVGLAARWPNRAEDAATLIRRANAALRYADTLAQDAQQNGDETLASGTWRAWNAALPG